MGATTGDVSKHVVDQNLNDREPVFAKTGAIASATKIQNKTGLNCDLYIPVEASTKITAIKLFNEAKVEVASLGALETVAAQKAQLHLKVPAGYYFELTIGAGSVGEGTFQT